MNSRIRGRDSFEQFDIFQADKIEWGVLFITIKHLISFELLECRYIGSSHDMNFVLI